jgi:hypothetical protein
MEDDQKTKEQLIQEVDALRRRVNELESQRDGNSNSMAQENEGRTDRRGIRTSVEFIADFDIVEARGVNISKGGICFATDYDLPFEMRFELDNQIHQHRAHLAWMKRTPDGGYIFGFMFVPSEQREAF